MLFRPTRSWEILTKNIVSEKMSTWPYKVFRSKLEGFIERAPSDPLNPLDKLLYGMKIKITE